MGMRSDSLSEGVSMASRSKSSPVSSSSSGEGERKAGGKSSETADSLRPEEDQQVTFTETPQTKKRPDQNTFLPKDRLRAGATRTFFFIGRDPDKARLLGGATDRK